MIANHKPHPRTARYGAQLAGKLRKVILDSLELFDKADVPLAQLLMDEGKKHPFKYTDMAAKYIPKEITAEITTAYTASNMTDDELADVIAERARKRHDDALKPDQDKLAVTG